MTSLIRNLKNERKQVKYGFKKEGNMLCTQEATEDKPMVMTKFPMDIGVIKRASNLKLINTRLKKAQDDYYEKYKCEPSKFKIPQALSYQWFIELAKKFLKGN